MPRACVRTAAPAALAVLLTVLSASSAITAEERISDRVFLVRDKPGTPTQFNLIVHAGCFDEPGGRCLGISHYLEHLVLTGRNPEHKDAGVRLIPDGTMNGVTTQRITRYFHTAPARPDGPRADLELLFDFYSGRLRDFSITPEDALRERNVVRQEYDWRTSSQPYGPFIRKLDHALIPDHPAGSFYTAEDVEAYTLDNAKAFHRNWYVLNNADFVIKGDIEPAALKEIADRALGKVAARTLPPRARPAAPVVVVERKDLQEEEPRVTRAAVYIKKLVRIEDGDLEAQRAARTIVLGFLQSRLVGSPNEVIVDRGKLAVGQLGVGITRVAPKTFTLSISGTVAPEGEPDKLRAAIEDYIAGLATRGIPEVSITRLQTRLADARSNADKDANAVYGRLVGWLAAGNSYDRLADWPQRLAAVTPADVAAVLQGLASPGRLVTGILSPPKIEPVP
jgi:zinc protease